MKVLHTSDLHLGASWFGRSRREDQHRVLNEILTLCDTNNVDALLVTGDIFSDRVEGGRHALIARRFLEQVRAHLDRGRVIMLLRGNHDPLDLFQLMRLLVDEMNGTTSWPLIVADLPGIYPVPGHDMQIIALPYITREMVRSSSSNSEVPPDQELPGLSGQLAMMLQRLYHRAESGTPAIFAGHILISGAAISESVGSEAGYASELVLDPGVLPQFTSYNALGHIHLSQQLKGVGKPTWYAGAPDRMDLGERAYTPQVLLVETPMTPGGVATVEPIQLTSCTPFVEETLDGSAAVDEFCAALPLNHKVDPLGRVMVSGVPAVANATIEAQIRRVAPRLDVRWDIPGIVRREVVTEEDPLDVPTVVAKYLDRAYADREKRGRRLLAAFHELWNETGEVLS